MANGSNIYDRALVGQPSISPSLFPEQARRTAEINIGNLLELAGAGLGCYGVDQIVGLRWALVAGAVLLIIAAELVYDAHRLKIRLPRRPRPVAYVRARKHVKKARHRRWHFPEVRLPRLRFPVWLAPASLVVSWRLWWAMRRRAG